MLPHHLLFPAAPIDTVLYAFSLLFCGNLYLQILVNWLLSFCLINLTTKLLQRISTNYESFGDRSVCWFCNTVRWEMSCSRWAEGVLGASSFFLLKAEGKCPVEAKGRLHLKPQNNVVASIPLEIYRQHASSYFLSYRSRQFIQFFFFLFCFCIMYHGM